MAGPQSLAEYLGVPDPRQQPGITPRDLPEPLDTLTGKQFAEAVLQSEEFRRYIVNGLVLGEIPPAVLCRLIDHGWGKPVERVEVHETFSTDDVPMDVIERRIQFLQQSIRLLRSSQKKDEEDSGESVH